MKNDPVAQFRDKQIYLAGLPAVWELGDEILLSNPLASRNNFKDKKAKVFVEGYFFMLVKQHPDNDKLWYAVIVDQNSYAKSELEIDFIDTQGHPNRVFPNHGLWLHTDDMPITRRTDRHGVDVAMKVQSMLANIVNGTVGNQYDDDFYLKYVAEFDAAIHAIEEKLNNS